MNHYQKLALVLSHGQDDAAAILQARTLASRCQSSLHLIHLIPAELGPDEAETALAGQLQKIRSPDIEVSTAQFVGRADEAPVVDWIQQLRPDLLIKSLQPESGLRRLFFTPGDWRLASQLPCPVWLVGDELLSAPQLAIAAVDIGGNATDDALNHRVILESRRLAQAFDAELHLAHICEPVIEVPEDAALQMMGTPPSLAIELEKLHQERFDQIASVHEIPASHRHLGHGYIQQGLEELGDKLQAGIIAVGSHDNSRLQRLFIGSVSADLISHARRSLMLVSTTVLGVAETAI